MLGYYLRIRIRTPFPEPKPDALPQHPLSGLPRSLGHLSDQIRSQLVLIWCPELCIHRLGYQSVPFVTRSCPLLCNGPIHFGFGFSPPYLVKIRSLSVFKSGCWSTDLSWKNRQSQFQFCLSFFLHPLFIPVSPESSPHSEPEP